MPDTDHAPTTDTPTALAEHGDVPDATPRGHSRRAFLGRTGTAAAAGAVLATTLTASPAAAATTTGKVRKAAVARAGEAPALPSVADVLARNVPVHQLEIVEQAALLQARTITSVSLTQAYLDRIDRFNGPFETYGDNGGCNTFVRVDRTGALAQAAAADAQLDAARAGTTPPAPYLCGIPIGIKDSVGIAGRTAGNGTPAFANNIALEDATAVARLRELGVVFLGHTICSAFSGVIAGNFAGNGWNKDYVPGGSSQGSGAAPINALASAAIGEETGGSIVWPAAINGASAIKPSLGLGSMAGVMPLSATYDVLGPLARSGRDAALLMNAIIGPDPLGDPQSVSAPNPFPTLPMAPRSGTKPLAGLVVGVPQTDWMTRSVLNADNTITATVVKESPQSLYDADHKAAFDRVRGELEALGATVKEFRGLDITNYGTAPDYLDGENPYYLNPAVLQTIDNAPITPRNAVVFSNRQEIQYLEAIEAFAATQSTTVQTTLLTQYGRRPGEVATADRTWAAAKLTTNRVTNGARREGERRRRLLIDKYQQSLDDAGVDIMLVMSIGQEVGRRNAANASDGLPLRRYNQIANDLSWPMVNFPVGQTSGAKLPICVQLWGPRFSEPRLVQAMIDYQAKHPEHHTRLPADPVAPAMRTLSRALRLQAAQGEAGEPDPYGTNDPVASENAAAADR
ncbi:amidase [Patulibacter minatonensis]|uniref:amidase n=1 Tax=Patulibacter minatonensis TaxID=298163 RepID=UPI0004B007D8|nr:amidase [Patulibacter minatonensis]